MKLITVSGKEITCQYKGNISDVSAVYETQHDAFEDTTLLTADELATVRFVDGTKTVDTYHNIVLENADILYEGDDVVCHFHFGEMSALELAIRTLQEEMVEVQEALVEG